MNVLFRETNKVLEVEDQLLCPDVQDEAGIDHNKLKNFFEFFQRKLRQVVLEAKNKGESSMHQLMVHDLFKPLTFSRPVCFAVNINTFLSKVES